MEEKRKFRTHPGVLGIIASVLLLASRFMVSSQMIALQSLNTVVVIVMLLVCVHLVRVTSAKRQAFVWRSWDTLILFLMPLAMLAITAVQLIMEPPAFITSRVFSAVLIFVSVPVFFSAYFWYVSGRLPQNRTLRVFSRLLACAVGIYVVLRLLNDVVFPVIQASTGKAPDPTLLAISGSNTSLSLLIGVLSLAGFILLCCEHDAGGKTEQTEQTEETEQKE